MLKLAKYIIFFIVSSLFSHECLILEDGNYGDCTTPLGYTWDGDGCSSTISGCSYNNIVTGEDDSDAFFATYEQCISFCFQHTGVAGDLNEDLEIDILDIVIIVNIIIQNIVPNNHEIWSSDTNQDYSTDILDIVILTNIIISGSQEQRDTFQIISEDIFTPYCTGCHYAGSFYAEQSGLVMTEDVLYDQIINITPTNIAAAEDNLVLVSNEGGIAGTLLSYLW